MCRNWRMWAALGGIAVLIAVAFPGARSTALPLLLVAACPLCMVLMGVGMAAAARREGHADAPAPKPDTERVGS